MARGLRINKHSHLEGVTVAEINPTAPHGVNLYSSVSPTASAAASGSGANFWGDDGFSFGDLLDLINPLHHLPIVGTLYRTATGDDISTGASILGGGLFGGILGAGVAVVNSVIEEATGGEIFDHIASLFGDQDAPQDAPETADLASAAMQAPFGRRAQEATWSDSIGNQPSAPATPTPLEHRYAQNPAFGRRAQEATMTSLAFNSPAPETVDIMVLSDKAPITAPTETAPSVMPEMGLQLIQTIALNAGYQSTPGPVDVIDRYSHQALAANLMTTKPVIVDSLY